MRKRPVTRDNDDDDDDDDVTRRPQHLELQNTTLKSTAHIILKVLG
jgi:hypothetical protein